MCDFVCMFQPCESASTKERRSAKRRPMPSLKTESDNNAPRVLSCISPRTSVVTGLTELLGEDPHSLFHLGNKNVEGTNVITG